jgi:hypothetical protein
MWQRHLPPIRWHILTRWFTTQVSRGQIPPLYVSVLLSLGAALADSNDAPAKLMRAIATIIPNLTTYPLLLMRASPERQNTAAASLQDALALKPPAAGAATAPPGLLHIAFSSEWPGGKPSLFPSASPIGENHSRRSVCRRGATRQGAGRRHVAYPFPDMRPGRASG